MTWSAPAHVSKSATKVLGFVLVKVPQLPWVVFSPLHKDFGISIASSKSISLDQGLGSKGKIWTSNLLLVKPKRYTASPPVSNVPFKIKYWVVRKLRESFYSRYGSCDSTQTRVWNRQEWAREIAYARPSLKNLFWGAWRLAGIVFVRRTEGRNIRFRRV